MEKEIDYRSLVLVGGCWKDTSDTYIESGQYVDGTEIEDEVLEQLAYDLDLSQMLFERF
jgi:hypothetical protein